MNHTLNIKDTLMVPSKYLSCFRQEKSIVFSSTGSRWNGQST